MQRFEGETLRVQREVVIVQQIEIQSLHNEIERMRMQQEASVQNVETASTSTAAELRSTVARLQHEVSVERAQREHEEKLNQETFQLWQEKTAN